jgi:hypothetical protein
LKKCSHKTFVKIFETKIYQFRKRFFAKKEKDKKRKENDAPAVGRRRCAAELRAAAAGERTT